MDAHQGDRIAVESNRVGVAARFGEVIEVLESPGGKHYRIQWDDGHQSDSFLGSDARVVTPPSR